MQQNNPVLPLFTEQVFPTVNIPIINSSLANSDNKTILEKLKNYEQLDSEQRLNVAKNLSVMLQQLEDQGIGLLKGLLVEIMKDKQNISRALLSQLPQLEKMLSHKQQHYLYLKTVFIPTLISYLNFSQLDIKEEAGKQLGYIAHKLTDNDRGDCVLRHVIEMAHDDVNQENRIVAVQLFSSMSQCFGKQLCQQFIGLEILSLGEDTSFKVRKQAIINLPIIGKQVSKQFFARLFQFYQSKTKDQSNWVLRKACIDIIIQMAQMCQPHQRQTILVEAMLFLLKDTTKWVRISAYKKLGRFIYCLKGLKIHQKLINQFCRMADNDVNSIGKDNQIMYSCAYHFPAVLEALGKQRWEGDLWKVYEKLLKSTDKKIKKTLSQSLHQISKILGQQLTQKYLFGVVDTFFKDKSDDIKLGMIRNMSEIMSVLSYQKRQSLIGVFEQFQKDQKKWRIRQCIGKQLGNILQIYSPQTIFEYVIPILFKFCSDSVSIVRQQAAGKVGDFLTKFESQPNYLPGIIESIKGFGSSPKYTQRQSFLIMCKKLMNHKELFEQNFMTIITEMASDKVVNVKLLLAEIVRDHILSHGPLSQNQSLIQLKQKLMEDQSQDVRDVFE